MLVVIGIIGVLAAIAIPAFAQYKARALDSEAIAHLQHVYRACKVYWLDNGSSGSCSVTIASGTAYGYIQTATVNITASGGETTFIGAASHVDSATAYTIDSAGNVS